MFYLHVRLRRHWTSKIGLQPDILAPNICITWEQLEVLKVFNAKYQGIYEVLHDVETIH